MEGPPDLLSPHATRPRSMEGLPPHLLPRLPFSVNIQCHSWRSPSICLYRVVMPAHPPGLSRRRTTVITTKLQPPRASIPPPSPPSPPASRMPPLHPQPPGNNTTQCAPIYGGGSEGGFKACVTETPSSSSPLATRAATARHRTRSCPLSPLSRVARLRLFGSGDLRCRGVRPAYGRAPSALCRA